MRGRVGGSGSIRSLGQASTSRYFSSSVRNRCDVGDTHHSSPIRPAIRLGSHRDHALAKPIPASIHSRPNRSWSIHRRQELPLLPARTPSRQLKSTTVRRQKRQTRIASSLSGCFEIFSSAPEARSRMLSTSRTFQSGSHCFRDDYQATSIQKRGRKSPIPGNGSNPRSIETGTERPAIGYPRRQV